MKGLRVSGLKKAEGPPTPQEVKTDTLAVSPVPFTGMFKKASKAAPPAPKPAPPAPKPAPLAPVPAQPEPAQPEPAQPEPAQPEPAQPAPAQPEPAQPVPAQPAPPEPAQPAQPEPAQPAPPEAQESAPKKRIIIKSVSKPPPELVSLQSSIVSTEKQNPYEGNEKSFAPADRKGFIKFIQTRYSNFALPRPLTKEINPNACNEMVLQTYKYQAFIREYMREASPYRGVLVYHGLGSGKTCTSIAASEALYGSGKKIIIMTPIALKENFLNELMFCGFRHFHLTNKWISFSLTPVVVTFAKTQIGLPESYIKRLEKGEVSKRLLWVPDLSVPESEANFKALESWQQAMIKEQIYEMLQNKFTFIGYTGSSKKFLKDLVINKPTFFDDAVIIIDEIHNLTRLMAGKIDKYLVPPKRAQTAFQQKDSAYEPVSVENWKPKFTDDSDKYTRAILFYRLLIQAKNSKIIALSGTPIVNTPLEIGILANILHGYFHAVTDTMTGDIERAKTLLEQHPRVNYFSVKKKDTGGIDLFFTKLDDGYVKYFNTDILEGLIYDENANETIEAIYADITLLFEKAGLTLGGKPEYSALPLLPPTYEAFNESFVNTDTLSLRNPITFKKRISGLISYYKG